MRCDNEICCAKFHTLLRHYFQLKKLQVLYKLADIPIIASDCQGPIFRQWVNASQILKNRWTSRFQRLWRESKERKKQVPGSAYDFLLSLLNIAMAPQHEPQEQLCVRMEVDERIISGLRDGRHTKNLEN